jgi:ATP-dependent Clp endopeptidase proteolytic subunit ClpP
MEDHQIDKMYSENNSETVNIDMDTNSIYFNAGINPKTMSNLIDKLLKLEKKILNKKKSLKRKFKKIKKDDNKSDKDDKDSDSENSISEQFDIKIEAKPIRLYITSNGGYVYQVFSAIDTILNLKVPVHTICKGFVASAGTLLSIAGEKRFITENSYMLIHELRAGSWGKFTHLSESFENSKQLMEHIKNYYIKRTKLTAEELEVQLKKDLSWNAEMCLEKGLVDEIIKF